MILAESLLYRIDQQLNKLSTNDHQQIPVEDKLLAINTATLKLIKRKLTPTGAAKVGMDGDKKRYQDLQFLVENATDHRLPLKEDDTTLHRWIVSTEKLDPPYLFYVDCYIQADKSNCKGRVVWVNSDLAPHGNITNLLTNSNYRPSFEHQETFCDLSEDEIGIFTDGSFTPTYCFLSYVRYPKKVDVEGYQDFQGKDSIHQNSELPEYLEDELLDIVVADLALYTENTSAYQGSSLNKQSNP